MEKKENYQPVFVASRNFPFRDAYCTAMVPSVLPGMAYHNRMTLATAANGQLNRIEPENHIIKHFLLCFILN